LPLWGGEPVLAPIRLRGTEALGRLYRYALDVVTVESPALSRWRAQELVVPDRLVGQVIDISIDFADNGCFETLESSDAVDAGTCSRTISGLITGVSLTGTDDRRARYRLIVRPWLWLATKNRESRIFQDASVMEITDRLLKECYPYPVVKELGGPGFCEPYAVSRMPPLPAVLLDVLSPSAVSGRLQRSAKHPVGVFVHDARKRLRGGCERRFPGRFAGSHWFAQDAGISLLLADPLHAGQAGLGVCETRYRSRAEKGL